ncbi:MAG: thioredoxin family protein [Flavobacteriales bacterium]|nr:thioredoxin family protein [Flavobacteriales bacterium]
MSVTPTTPVKLGYTAPEFQLRDVVSNSHVSFSDVSKENGIVVMFICNHCPFVVHVLDELIRIGNHYQDQGIGFVAISSNDVSNYPQDSPEKMKELALKTIFPFPYLYDETQEVAKAYFAACTPDFSVFDKEAICVYRGQLDDSSPGNSEHVHGEDLRKILDQLINETPVSINQKPSIGCNIKWKTGNQPDYV